MNYRDEKQNLIERIEKIYNTISDFKYTPIAHRLLDMKNEIIKELQFNVLCIGEFSTGKSTFINKFFIKKDILPTSFTETTAKLTFIKYGEEEKIVIHYIDKEKEPYVIKGLQEDKLQEFLTKEGNHVNDVDYVEVFINSEILKEGISIIDSPGLNAPESERVKLTYNFVQKADAVLYILSALQAWKKTEKDFIEEKIMRKEDLDKIFFLINFWDKIEDDEKEIVLNFIRSEMKKSLEVAKRDLGADIPEPMMIPISAKTGFNLDNLDKELTEYLTSKKAADILEQKRRQLEAVKKDIIKYLKELIENYKKDKLDLEREMQKLKEQISELEKQEQERRESIKDSLNNEFNRFISNIQQDYSIVGDEIIESIKRLSQDNLSKSNIKDRILKNITIRLKKLNSEIEESVKSFYEEIKKVIREKKAKLKLDEYNIVNTFNAQKLQEEIIGIIEEQIGDIQEVKDEINEKFFVLRIFYKVFDKKIDIAMQERINWIVQDIQRSIENIPRNIDKIKHSLLNTILDNIEFEIKQSYIAKTKDLENVINKQNIKDEEMKRLSDIIQQLERI